MSTLRNFLYRFPRFRSKTSMDLIYGDTVVLGLCLEISESGLRGTFSSSVLPGTEGLLTLYRDDRSFSTHALVLETNKNGTTVKFQLQTQQEEVAVREFIKLLSSCSAS